MKLTNSGQSDNYGCAGYSTGFDATLYYTFSCQMVKFGENIIIFGVNNSSSAHFVNRKKILKLLVKFQ